MELKIRKISDIYIIDIEGDIDLYSAHQLKVLFEKMLDKNIQAIIINFENVGYLDSCGIGCLIFIHMKMKERHGKLSYCGFNSSPAKLLELTKVNKIFNIEDCVEDSVLSLK